MPNCDSDSPPEVHMLRISLVEGANALTQLGESGKTCNKTKAQAERKNHCPAVDRQIDLCKKHCRVAQAIAMTMAIETKISLPIG